MNNYNVNRNMILNALLLLDNHDYIKPYKILKIASP